MALDETVFRALVPGSIGGLKLAGARGGFPFTDATPSRRRAIPSILSPFQPAKGEASLRSCNTNFTWR
jgi:hypothetical protein